MVSAVNVAAVCLMLAGLMSPGDGAAITLTCRKVRCAWWWCGKDRDECESVEYGSGYCTNEGNEKCQLWKYGKNFPHKSFKTWGRIADCRCDCIPQGQCQLPPPPTPLSSPRPPTCGELCNEKFDSCRAGGNIGACYHAKYACYDAC